MSEKRYNLKLRCPGCKRVAFWVREDGVVEWRCKRPRCGRFISTLIAGDREYELKVLPLVRPSTQRTGDGEALG
jgi:hypothetical protein